MLFSILLRLGSSGGSLILDSFYPSHMDRLISSNKSSVQPSESISLKLLRDDVSCFSLKERSLHE